MYAIIPQQIPQDRRAEVNEKILFAIDSGKDLIPAESISTRTPISRNATSGNITRNNALTSLSAIRLST